MMDGILLGIDIGTTNTKGAVIHPSGRILAEATLPASLDSPHPGWAEADPEQWWANVCDICKRLANDEGFTRDRYQEMNAVFRQLYENTKSLFTTLS